MTKYGAKKYGESLADSSFTEAGTGESHIGKSLTITGELSSREPLTVNGRIEGNIDSSSRIIIGRSGRFHGEIRADAVRIIGKAKGEISASGKLEIRREGDLEGNINTPRLIIEEGARFNGKSQMTGDATPPPETGPKPRQSVSPAEKDKKPG